MTLLPASARPASLQADREHGAGPYSNQGHSLESPIIHRLDGGLVFLKVLFRLIREHWAHSGCPGVLLRAFLFLCTGIWLCRITQSQMK